MSTPDDVSEWIDAKEVRPPVSWPAPGFNGVTPLVIKLASSHEKEIANVVWDGVWFHFCDRAAAYNAEWHIVGYNQITHWRQAR
jgi:hypothetical protein